MYAFVTKQLTCLVALMQDVWKAAHAIKGAALTLAINPLGNAAKNLEEVGRAIDEAYKAQNTKVRVLFLVLMKIVPALL